MTDLPPEGADLPSSTFRHPDADAGPWEIVLRWRVLDGRPECVGITVDLAADNPSGAHPFSEAVLRRAGLAKRIAVERARMVATAVAQRGVPPGMRRSTYDRLARVAAVYRAALADREAPLQAVQREFGTTAGYAANLVSRARSVGLIPATSPGVPMGDVDR